MNEIYLIGLGNPGKKYTKRRGGLIIDDKIIIAERVKKLFSESIELIIAKNIMYDDHT